MGGDRAVAKGLCVLPPEPGAVPCHRKHQRCGRGCGRGHGTALRGHKGMAMQTLAFVPHSLGQQEKPSGQFNQQGTPFSGFNLLK